jgi:hypothetical protein
LRQCWHNRLSEPIVSALRVTGETDRLGVVTNLHAVAMNDMRNLETGEVNVADMPELIARIVSIELFVNVRDDPIALALADTEGLSIARIDESVDVRLEFHCDFRPEGGHLTGYVPIVHRQCR